MSANGQIPPIFRTSVRAINRLMCVGETMRFALGHPGGRSWRMEASAQSCGLARSVWASYRREAVAAIRQASRLAAAETIGRDGSRLLTDLFDEAAPADLAGNSCRQHPDARVRVQNYRYDEGQLHWREPSDIPPAALAHQFADAIKKPERRKKYSTRWTGYKVHLTETCEADQPHLLIHVATTPAPESDVSMTESIQANLQEAQVLPSQHLLDTGYINADVLVKSRASLWD